MEASSFESVQVMQRRSWQRQHVLAYLYVRCRRANYMRYEPETDGTITKPHAERALAICDGLSDFQAAPARENFTAQIRHFLRHDLMMEEAVDDEQWQPMVAAAMSDFVRNRI